VFEIRIKRKSPFVHQKHKESPKSEHLQIDEAFVKRNLKKDKLFVKRNLEEEEMFVKRNLNELLESSTRHNVLQ